MTLSWFGRRDLLRRWRTCDGLEDVRAEAGSWSANTMRPYVADRLTQQPDAVLAMVAGYRSEFVENPPFVPLGCLLVPVPDRRHKFLLRHLADASAHVAASRVFDNILVEAITFVE